LIRKPFIIELWAIALILFVLLGAMNLYWGDLNQDEGWYLYAARQVTQGKLPYRDYAFTQGPMLPLVYARAQCFVDRWGLAGGRLFTMGLGLLSALGASWLAARTAPKKWAAVAGVIAFILIAGNVYQSYFTTVVKTYALCSVFLVAGLLAASFARGRGGVPACFLSGLLLALAAGTRISAGAAMPVVGVYLLTQRKALGDAKWLSFGVGGVLGLVGIGLPFFLMAPEGFRFGMFEYHTFRSAGGLLPALVYKAGFISRFVQAYYLAACLAVFVLLFRWFRPAEKPEDGDTPRYFNIMTWSAALAITTVHFSAPFPYEDYQAFVFPVFAAALAISLVRYLTGAKADERVARATLVVIFLVSIAAAFSSPVNQDWFVRGRDRIWWRLKDESALQKLRDVSAWVAEHAGSDRTVLTQDTYIAVEAGLDVPAGLEMGPFSYFPDFSREKAETLHVLNREMMRELLENTPARVAAFSGYGLSIACPEVAEVPREEWLEMWDIILQRYQAVFEADHFGQAHTPLVLLTIRTPAPEEP